MKNVARQKKVPVVDMTALTKEFVEDLGADATNQQILCSYRWNFIRKLPEQLVMQE